MSNINDTVVFAHPTTPLAGIRPVHPQIEPQAHLCQMALNIGVFFDGTGNNQHWVEPGESKTQYDRRKQSNVARLHRAYREDAPASPQPPQPPRP